MEEDPWTSESTNATLPPLSESQTAKWTATVDFPTPPFWFATATIMVLSYFVDYLLARYFVFRKSGFL
jgi:hypothetical protein